MVRSHRSEQRFVLRANIILLCADGMTGKAIAQKLGTRPNTVSKWINRWIDFFTPAQLASSQSKTEEEQEEQLELKAVLGDSPRPGTPPTFDVEACVAIVALACELPSKHNREITNWTHRELREEILMQKLVSEISVRQVGRILAEAQLQPHRNRYWLNSKGDPKKDERIADICDCYNKALQNPKHEVYYNFDEATGIQAIERIAKDIAMEACKPRRVEFEYKRHGTTCLLAARDIATGIVTGWCNLRWPEKRSRRLRAFSRFSAGRVYCSVMLGFVKFDYAAGCEIFMLEALAECMKISSPPSRPSSSRSNSGGTPR